MHLWYIAHLLDTMMIGTPHCIHHDWNISYIIIGTIHYIPWCLEMHTKCFANIFVTIIFDEFVLTSRQVNHIELQYSWPPSKGGIHLEKTCSVISLKCNPLFYLFKDLQKIYFPLSLWSTYPNIIIKYSCHFLTTNM